MNESGISISKWISVLYRCRKGYVGRILEPYGISGCQYLFIMTLYLNSGASQEKISSALQIDKTTTARAIKKLESEGFVVRHVDDEDKRAYKVYLTQKALDIIPQIKAASKQWEDIITTDITEAEYSSLEKLLNNMADKAWDMACL